MGAREWWRPEPAALALAALLAVLSWHSAWNLGGPVAAVGYSLVLVVVVPMLLGAADRVRPGRVLVVVALVALVAAFVVGIPAELGDALGVGSDRADALDVALSRLAAGRYPYTATTYLGNPITPLPGALLLAAPFWAVTGRAATQNVAWLVLFAAVLGAGRRPRPTAVWIVTVVGGLEVLREFLVGDDLVGSAVPALAATVWVLAAARRSPAELVAAALALGVTTCTRPHLALVVVIVAVAVGVAAGPRRAVLVGACGAGAWIALIGPFLAGGLARFSPVHVAAKVTGDRAVTPGLVMIVLVTLALLAAGLWVLRPASPAAVGGCCAAVLAAPSLLSLVHGLIVGPSTDIDLTLGAAAVPFAAWATAAEGGVGSRRRTPDRRPSP